METSKVKALGYCRCSTLTNSEGDTFVRQMKAIKSYAAQNGMEIVRGFEEVVRGATEWENRPAWVEMMNSLNGVRTIVIERLDRLARDLMVQEHILRDLKDRGITLVSVAEPDLGSDEPTRKLMRHIAGAIAEYEKAMIVSKLRGARERKRETHGKCEGRKPFGDRPGELLTIEEMARLRSLGGSYTSIADHLNVNAMQSRTGGPWRADVIREILLRQKK